MLMASGFCCCGNVLFWKTNGGLSAMSLAQTVYTNMGLTVHDNTNWSGSIDNYKLIIWLVALSDPTWWPAITGGTWNGRLLLTCEHDSFNLASNTYVNGLAGLTGMGVTNDHIDSFCSHDGSAEADPLNAGVTTIKFALTSQITGGTVLSKTATGASPWMAHNKVGTIDFVACGDSNHISDECGAGVITNNTPFLQNLWNVTV